MVTIIQFIFSVSLRIFHYNMGKAFLRAYLSAARSNLLQHIALLETLLHNHNIHLLIFLVFLCILFYITSFNLFTHNHLSQIGNFFFIPGYSLSISVLIVKPISKVIQNLIILLMKLFLFIFTSLNVM